MMKKTTFLACLCFGTEIGKFGTNGDVFAKTPRHIILAV